MQIKIYSIGDYPFSFYAIAADSHGNFSSRNMLKHFRDTFIEINAYEKFHGIWFESGLNTEIYSEYIIHGKNDNINQDILLTLAIAFSEMFDCDVKII